MKITSAIAGFLLLAGIFACAPPPFPGITQTPGTGEEVPDFSLETLDDGIVVLSELLKGDKKIMLVFWTTRCSHCVRAIPAINEFYDENRGEIEIVSVNVRESRERVEKFAAAAGMSYAVALDGGGAAARKFNVVGVPTYILISPDGGILYSGHSFEDAKMKTGL